MAEGYCEEYKGVGASVSAGTFERVAKVCDTPQEEEESLLALSPEAEVEKQIREIAEQEGFEDADLLIRIAQCESGLVPERDSDVSYSSAVSPCKSSI